MEFIPTVSMRYLIKHVIDCLKDPLFEGLLKTTKKSPKNRPQNRNMIRFVDTDMPVISYSHSEEVHSASLGQ